MASALRCVSTQEQNGRLARQRTRSGYCARRTTLYGRANAPLSLSLAPPHATSPLQLWAPSWPCPVADRQRWGAARRRHGRRDRLPRARRHRRRRRRGPRRRRARPTCVITTAGDDERARDGLRIASSDAITSSESSPCRARTGPRGSPGRSCDSARGAAGRVGALHAEQAALLLLPAALPPLDSPPKPVKKLALAPAAAAPAAYASNCAMGRRPTRRGLRRRPMPGAPGTRRGHPIVPVAHEEREQLAALAAGSADAAPPLQRLLKTIRAPVRSGRRAAPRRALPAPRRGGRWARRSSRASPPPRTRRGRPSRGSTPSRAASRRHSPASS